MPNVQKVIAEDALSHMDANFMLALEHRVRRDREELIRMPYEVTSRQIFLQVVLTALSAEYRADPNNMPALAATLDRLMYRGTALIDKVRGTQAKNAQ